VQVRTIKPRPPHPTIAAGSRGSLRQCRIDRATRPPAASSHARVGSEKNAQAGDVRVHTMSAASDAAATTARTAAYGPAPAVAPGRTRPSAHAVPMMSSGHTR
ncbi:Mycobacterium terramassiliense ORFan, partial [Mycobacterium terramassiliense]